MTKVVSGKAATLAQLVEAGFAVPNFFICDQSWSEIELQAEICTRLPLTTHFAVRSSALGEDSRTQSFAGQFYSAVGVPRMEVYAEVQKVVAAYQGRAGVVIVQEFIPSTASGVLFTDAGDGTMVMNANAGLCKSVVEGGSCDEYILGRDGGIYEQTIPVTKSSVHFTPAGQFVWQDNHSEALSRRQIEQVVTLGRLVEEFFDAPQDIEWCFLGTKLFLLQSRPITKQLVTEAVYFDSANIAESYSGIVLPLTYSFAQRVYRQVYIDFLQASGVSRKQLATHGYVFRNLLGCFHGRMYYNMNNWYRMAQFVPGYQRNKSNFELMITSRLSHSIRTTIKPGRLLRFCYPCIVFAKLCVFGHTNRRFERSVQASIAHLRSYDIPLLSIPDCLRLFRQLESGPLRRWYVTLENDFFVMTYLGILQKLIPAAEIQNKIIFESKATEQVAALQTLAHSFKCHADLWQAITTRDSVEYRRLLLVYPATYHLYTEYFSRFSGRFANELKLETRGLDEDVGTFLTVIEAYASYVSPAVQTESGEVTPLSFTRRMSALYVLQKFKKYAAKREVYRLLRSTMFSLTRSLFTQVGKQLVVQGLLTSVDDVFYLTVDEILAYDDAVVLQRFDYSAIVRERRSAYDLHAEKNPPAHFVTTDNAVPAAASAGQALEVVSARGVSSGIIRGRVKVLKEFRMPEKIDFDILVTRHTDPGWTALIALSKGLVIEHGGVLSHASIIARELGIPAVIGVSGATDTFYDGQIIEVNGSDGTIRTITI